MNDNVKNNVDIEELRNFKNEVIGFTNEETKNFKGCLNYVFVCQRIAKKLENKWDQLKNLLRIQIKHFILFIGRNTDI